MQPDQNQPVDPQDAPVQLAQSRMPAQTTPTQDQGVEQQPDQAGVASSAQTMPSVTSQPMPEQQPVSQVPQQPDPSFQQDQGGLPVIGSSPKVMNEAPESMRRQQPSAFVPGVTEKKPRKRKFVCACILGIFLFLILGFGGLGAYAYFTDAEIPVVSDVVRKIEEFFRNPQEEAKKAAEQVADTFLAAFLPVIAQEEGVASAFAKSTVSQDYIKQFIEENQDIQSFQYDLSMNFDFESGGNESLEDMVSNIDVEMAGAIDTKEEGNEKIKTDFDASLGDDSMTMSVKGEMRMIGNDSYVKIDEYPVLFSTYIGSIEGQWIDLATTDVEETADLLVSEETGTSNITDEDVDNLIEFMTDETVLKNAEILPDEEIGGNKCYCVKVSWNQNELKDVIRRYYEIYDQEYDEEEINNAVEGLNSMEVETCVGKKSNMVHRIKAKIEGESDGNKMAMEANLKLWDYGGTMNITAPEGAVTLEEAMADSPLMTVSQDAEVKAEMLNIQIALEEYYVNNMKYPESLAEAGVEKTTFYEEEVHYTKGETGYELWIVLPSGEKYDISSE
ncbi:hypothetical protein JW766_03375 [Candidatus Dojkabacteria bacterium]|nr:hypothetical protein [Candidatus Dojkabacteria bacterium]